MDSALFLLGLLWAMLGTRKTGAPSERQIEPRESLPPVQRTSSTPAPWPQVVPSGLPSFPGSGWEYDDPPPKAVQQRASQLANGLWKGGSGTYKIEQTAARWIAYRAEKVASGKKGVVAYRLKKVKPAPSPTRSLPSSPRASAPSSPSSAPSVLTSASPQVHSQLALPTLRRGAGAKPGLPNPDVRLLQQRLGIPDDGRFGTGTESAVRAWQRSHGLKIDGEVGPKTWASLFSTQSAPSISIAV